MEIGTVLQEADRSPKNELQLLANYFAKGLKLNAAVEKQLTCVLQLCGLQKPLKTLMIKDPNNERLPRSA